MADIKKAPEFCLPDHNQNEVCLSDFEGKWVILYSYPRANTSGCTKEALGFTEMKDEFEQLGAVIIGISPDSLKAISSFIDKHDLEIILLSDKEEKKVLKDYGSWQLKKSRGNEKMGVVRSTYIISPDRNIVKTYDKVKVKGHVDKVLNELKELIA
ncbi:MAG: peroxiredoxin [Candidatus Zixiibacteriota bacterium]